MLPFQSDEMFPFSLSAADLGVVILHDSVSRGSVPSKAYNLMSFGIPALYIAAEDSELARYAKEFGCGVCFSVSRVNEMVGFIQALKDSSGCQRGMAERSLRAAQQFTPTNADLFVSSYVSD